MNPSLRAAQVQSEGALEPPPGVVPNFVHPFSLEGYVLGTQIIFFILVPICVLPRLYTSFFIIRRVGIEDYTCLASWLLAIVYSILILELGRHGGGVHQWNVHAEEIIPFLKLVIAGELVYAFLVYLVKTTILLLYIRIFGINRKTKRMIQLLIIILFSYYLASIGAKAAICIPLQKLWNPELDGHCINNTVFLLTDCAVSIISDFTILILPMPLVWALQMPTRRKTEIMTVFAMGLFACVSSVMRMYYSGIGIGRHDITFNYAQIWLWSIPEVNCGIICGCLPILPAFIRHFHTELLSSSQNSNPKNWRYPSSSINHRRRHLGAGDLDTNDIELDEADLIGRSAGESLETPVSSNDATKVGRAVQKGGILRKIDIEQSYQGQTVGH